MATIDLEKAGAKLMQQLLDGKIDVRDYDRRMAFLAAERNQQKTTEAE